MRYHYADRYSSSLTKPGLLATPIRDTLYRNILVNFVVSSYSS